MMAAISGTASRVFTGTVQTRAFMAPNHSTAKASEFLVSTAMRAPGAMPAAIRAWAQRLAWASRVA